MLSRVPWRASCSRTAVLRRGFGTSAPVRRIADELFANAPAETLANFPLVTAVELARQDKLPTGVRMLARDFIDNSLYNPHYGYFSKRAVIFSTGQDSAKGFDFANIKDGLRFDGAVAQRYQEYGEDPRTGPGRQIWHTPTELFKVCLQLSHRTVLIPVSAVVWTGHCPMSSVRISSEVLPLRRLYHI